MKQRTIVSFLAIAGAVWWLAHRSATPSSRDLRQADTATLDLFREAKARLDDARAAFAAHDLDRARQALVAAAALTPAMERDAPALGAVTGASIVERVLDLLDTHPELDADARREILACADVTPSNLPGVGPRARAALDHARDVAARLATAKRAVE